MKNKVKIFFIQQWGKKEIKRKQSHVHDMHNTKLTKSLKTKIITVLTVGSLEWTY